MSGWQSEAWQRVKQTGSVDADFADALAEAHGIRSRIVTQWLAHHDIARASSPLIPREFRPVPLSRYFVSRDGVLLRDLGDRPLRQYANGNGRYRLHMGGRHYDEARPEELAARTFQERKVAPSLTPITWDGK